MLTKLRERAAILGMVCHLCTSKLSRLSFCVILTGYVLTSCVRVDLYKIYTEGRVLIRPDMSVHTLPALQYHFYPTDGEAKFLNLSCDGQGNFSGDIPLGTYCAIATNTDAPNVTFTNTTDYEQATVSLSPMDASSRSGYTLFFQPGPVYSVPVEGFTVIGGDTLRHFPRPVLLTKSINFRFIFQDGLAGEVDGIEGLVHGVYPSVYLYDCCTKEEDIATVLSSAVPFKAGLSNNNWSATVPLFDLCNPQYGESYTYTLPVTITFKGYELRLSVNGEK